MLPGDVKAYTSKSERLESAPRDKQLRILVNSEPLRLEKERVEVKSAQKIREREKR